MTEPLHVQVARALGCRPEWHEGHDWWLCGCNDDSHVATSEIEDGEAIGPPILRAYDTDWSACGPLLERFKIETTFTPHKGGPEEWTATAWLPPREPQEVKRISGPTPLIAVCNLILALHKEGKLNAA